jgi:UDP-N-acetyl-D-galactosamine dehydrogenase
MHEYGLKLSGLEAFRELDAVILAVAHKEYVQLGASGISAMVRAGGVVVDVKSALSPAAVAPGLRYWSL